MSDHRVQLIIDAINNTQAGFNSLQSDLSNISGGIASLNSSFQRVATQCNQLRSGFGMLAIEFNALADVGHRLAGVFTPVVKIALDYNKQLEISGLGISAILTSMTTMKNAQGQILTGSEKWQEATRYTAQAQGELQKIAMTTAVTYQELVAAYQGILAPALAAKMNFKEITEFTGLMANSVKAIGLPMQQIVQESRDMVAGTIDQNSQLSKSLGITNEDVKKWREKGTVFDEVKKRLVGFVYASNEFNSTWEGAWSNFKDIAQRALGEGLKPAFDGLRGQIDKVTESFVNITKDATGKIIDIQVKPEVVATLKNIAFEFNRIVDLMTRFSGILTTIAEPVLYTAIAISIGKIGVAIRGVSIEIASANRLVAGSVIGAMLMASYSLVKGGIDASRDSEEVDTVKSIYTGIGGKPGGEIDNLTPSLYRKVVDKTAMTPEQMALALKQKQLWLYPRTLDSDEDFIFKQSEFDKSASDRTKPTGSIKGNKVPLTKEQIAEANANAIASAGLTRQTSNDKTSLSLETDLESVKEWLRQRKILHEKGTIDTNQWIADQQQAKDEEIALEEYATIQKMKALNTEWEAKRTHYVKSADLDKAYSAYLKEYGKLELDLTKTKNKTGAAEDEAELARIAEFGKRKKQTLAETLKAIDDQAKSHQRDLETQRSSGDISSSGYDSALVKSQQLSAMGKRNVLNAAINAGGKPEELQTLRADLAGVDEELTRLDMSAQKLSLERDWFSGMKRGLQSYADAATNMGAQLESTFTNAFKGMEDALVNFTMTGKLNFSDMAKSIITDLIRIQIRTSITGPLSAALSGAIGNMFSGGGSNSGMGSVIESGTFNSGTIGVVHDGGMIVPRFHFGGLASDEVPAILQTRERVLSREQAGLFEKFVNKTEGVTTGNVQVNVINQSGTQVSAEQSQPRFDGEQMIINVVLKKLKGDPSFRNALATGGAY